MKRIADFSEVSPLILKYFKRGVITNSFLTPADYRAEIAEGNLFYDEAGGNLYLYVKRDGFLLCFFYIINAGIPFPEVGEKQILEAGERAYSIAEADGFERILERVQLKKASPEGYVCSDAEKADAECAEEIFELLKNSFNPLTGNLPSLTQIRQECNEGMAYVIKKEGRCAGVLRSEVSAKAARIKHLAVKEECRGMGMARKLTQAFLAENSGKSCSVWTGSDNIAAKALYKSLGFTEDGNKTIVYMKG